MGALLCSEGVGGGTSVKVCLACQQYDCGNAQVSSTGTDLEYGLVYAGSGASDRGSRHTTGTGMQVCYNAVLEGMPG